MGQAPTRSVPACCYWTGRSRCAASLRFPELPRGVIGNLSQNVAGRRGSLRGDMDTCTIMVGGLKKAMPGLDSAAVWPHARSVDKSRQNAKTQGQRSDPIDLGSLQSGQRRSDAPSATDVQLGNTHHTNWGGRWMLANACQCLLGYISGSCCRPWKSRTHRPAVARNRPLFWMLHYDLYLHILHRNTGTCHRQPPTTSVMRIRSSKRLASDTCAQWQQ
jgi:hypothetical protein